MRHVYTDSDLTAAIDTDAETLEITHGTGLEQCHIHVDFIEYEPETWAELGRIFAMIGEYVQTHYELQESEED